MYPLQYCDAGFYEVGTFDIFPINWFLRLRWFANCFLPQSKDDFVI